MSNLVNHAMNEFRAAGWIKEDGSYVDVMQGMICENIIDLLKVFSSQGHSGTSAPYVIKHFTALADFKPIVPLTGEDWEWNCISDDRTNNRKIYQNNRCSSVFKDTDSFGGNPYDINGKVFWEWCRSNNGEIYKSAYTGYESRVEIQFPYTPKSVYVFVPTEEFPTEELKNE